MLNVVSIFEDVTKDSANIDQNGSLSISRFNRQSRRGELRLIDYLTGSLTGQQPPIPYLSQKNKDWLAPFITKFPVNVSGGVFTRPADYYQYESMYRVAPPPSDCEEETEPKEMPNATITLLDGAKFDKRSSTYIEELIPSLDNAIVQQVGKDFEFAPKDMGPVILRYIRYPVFGVIGTKIDPVYNEEVPDLATTIDYEWDEMAREILIWFITNSFADTNREQASKQFNAATGKTAHG